MRRTTLALLAALTLAARALAQEADRGDAKVTHNRDLVATTEWLCAMDADGQYDPNDIVRLMDQAEKTRADAVWGVRVAREDNALRFVSSTVGRMARRLILGTTVVLEYLRRTMINYCITMR